MWNMKKYMVAACLLLTFSGCDFLDYDETSGKTKEEAFSYYDNINRQVAHVYSYLPEDFGSVKSAMLEAGTDNAIFTYENNPIHYLNNGVWSALERVDDQWDLWKGIRTANSFLENFDPSVFDRFEFNDEYTDMVEKAARFPYEVRFLRAYFYFELAKRYGNIPLLKRTYNEEEINHITQTPFEEVVQFIVDECTEVAKKLPVNQAEVRNETGRATKGAALALKSRVLLYAASALHNPTNYSSKWEAAAEAANEVIELNAYEMPSIKNDPLYSKEGGNKVLSSKQLIFERRNGSLRNNFEAQNQPMGYEGTTVGGGNTPTQNLVDAFEMKDGTPFDWSNATHVEEMYYDNAGNPTRDPRLYLNVLTNGTEWLKNTVETFEGGKNKVLDGATKTGYYLRKYMNPSVSLDPDRPIKVEHHYILFRYAEILLNYAEAMNEWKGPNDKGTCKYTATEAINLVREAAGMPAINESDQAIFRERVRNERRIELAFEGHRFFDIRRWKIANDTNVKEIYGVTINKTATGFTYEKKLIATHQWNDKMYLYPYPQHELYKNPGLHQNKGW